ncbi:MAG TPA: HNH endonuclease signature motif containing protein [Planctomycetota bacterium]|nr:HNH endonuclease signature motif containing protein [Planctomycetota bacterium]
MNSPNPFRYPTTVHVRKHGPHGYAKYGHFRPWLRDEFDFRCVYCLWREMWLPALSIFEVDHFIAIAVDKTLEKRYENLVYACRNCNNRKSSKSVINPEAIAFGSCVRVLDSGEIEALNDDGIRLIDDLGLDQPKICETRRNFIGWAHSFAKNDWPEFLRFMGFPSDLPDLENLEHPPNGNTRKEGIAQSWFQRKRRGELPEFYE